jgi:F0F1-type ATP synthase membrane subunit b/b'
VAEEEKSLLSQVHEKELELKEQFELACREAEKRLDSVRKEAAAIISEAEKIGQQEADNYYRKENEALREEIDRLKKEKDALNLEVKERGERNLPVATEKIIQHVISR